MCTFTRVTYKQCGHVLEAAFSGSLCSAALAKNPPWPCTWDTCRYIEWEEDGQCRGCTGEAVFAQCS